MRFKIHSSTAKTLGLGGAMVAVMLSALPAHARPGIALNGTSFQGIGAQGASPNGLGAQGIGARGLGLGPQGGSPSWREAEAVDLGALVLRAVRLPDSRMSPVARE